LTADDELTLFIFELNDVFVHRLDLVGILAQPDDTAGASFQYNRLAYFESHVTRFYVPILDRRL